MMASRLYVFLRIRSGSQTLFSTTMLLAIFKLKARQKLSLNMMA
ncbi:unnamed protein product [Gulo gulo]|uniref:Uncharacterized protein n=1 Tax=Gulo gulo TaxID=48420 RepID=A0A9X9MD88_GULGU|nr:unnamed protein product [Gulo gulo]